MTDAEKLVMFMQKKTDILMSAGMKRRSLYFNKKDKKALLDLTDLEAGWAWRMIKRDAGNRHGLYAETCPFCIVYNDCADCPYGQHHGICESEEKSNFAQVCYFYSDKLTSKAYQRILREIEEKEGREV